MLTVPQTQNLSQTGEFVRSLEGGSISLDKITLILGQNLKAGTVLGKITASGKYTLHDNAAADGSQNAAAVLFQDCDASAADKATVAVTRLAELNANHLTYKAGITGPNKTAAIAALAALNIIVRA